MQKKFALRAILLINWGWILVLCPALNNLHGFDFLSDRLVHNGYMYKTLGIAGDFPVCRCKS
jgi:hypothetical protein